MNKINALFLAAFKAKKQIFRMLTGIFMMYFFISCLLLIKIPVALAELKEPFRTCNVGIYILSLKELKPADKSFNTDFWLWTVCPTNDIQPLKTMEVSNAKEISKSEEFVREKNDIYASFHTQNKVFWSTQKINATLSHKWNVNNYPFDRHVLEIPLQETVKDATKFVYTPDKSRSALNKNIRLEGWQINDFIIEEKKVYYQTSLGNPELPISSGSNYSRLVASISISRDGVTGFFKLTSGVYISFALTVLSFFYDVGQTSLVSARSSLLVGSLFATLVNMRAVDSVLGRTEGLLLVDRIHITTIVYILLAAIITVYSRLLCETGGEKFAVYFDRRICVGLFTISYAIANAVIVMSAVYAG